MSVRAQGGSSPAPLDSAIESICDKLDIFANVKGCFYINPKLLIETLMRHYLNNFYQKAYGSLSFY